MREDIFPAHRIVLAANSDYFHAMFSAGMKESNKEVIELRDERISPDALSVVQQCCDFLKREFIQLRLDLHNYCLLTTVAYRHSLGDLPAIGSRAQDGINVQGYL